jgi:hypothetical protein
VLQLRIKATTETTVSLRNYSRYLINSLSTLFKFLILVGDFSTKLGRGDSLKPQLAVKVYLEMVLEFATYKNKIARAQCSQSEHS